MYHCIKCNRASPVQSLLVCRDCENGKTGKNRAGKLAYRANIIETKNEQEPYFKARVPDDLLKG